MIPSKTLSLVVLCGALLAGPAAAQDWVTFSDESIGLRMLVPAKTKMVDAGEDGWEGRRGMLAPVEILVTAAKDPPDTGVMLKSAAKVVGIPETAWRMTDEGRDTNGWKWIRAYQATDGKTMVYALLGHASKSSRGVHPVSEDDRCRLHCQQGCLLDLV